MALQVTDLLTAEDVAANNIGSDALGNDFNPTDTTLVSAYNASPKEITERAIHAASGEVADYLNFAPIAKAYSKYPPNYKWRYVEGRGKYVYYNREYPVNEVQEQLTIEEQRTIVSGARLQELNLMAGWRRDSSQSLADLGLDSNWSNDPPILPDPIKRVAFNLTMWHLQRSIMGMYAFEQQNEEIGQSAITTNAVKYDYKQRELQTIAGWRVFL